MSAPHDGAFCGVCGKRYAGELPDCDHPEREMIPGSDLPSALARTAQERDGWEAFAEQNVKVALDRVEAAESEIDALREELEAARRVADGYARVLADRGLL